MECQFQKIDLKLNQIVVCVIPTDHKQKWWIKIMKHVQVASRVSNRITTTTTITKKNINQSTHSHKVLLNNQTKRRQNPSPVPPLRPRPHNSPPYFPPTQTDPYQTITHMTHTPLTKTRTMTLTTGKRSLLRNGLGRIQCELIRKPQCPSDR